MWFVCSQKTGASALGLKRVLGLGSYETAWTWMHKLRRAMVRPDRDRLGGPDVIVELDETFIGGGSGVGKRGRYENKATVVIAVERRQPKGLGRVRMRQVSDHRKDEVLAFAQECIAPGSIVYTDGATMYKRLPAMAGVIHEPIILTSSKDPAHVVLPGVHRVASLLDRWLAGTPPMGRRRPTSTTTSTSTPSASTAVPAAAGGCSSTDSSSRPPIQTLTPSTSSSPTLTVATGVKQIPHTYPRDRSV
jgi:hypothetical protein